MIPRMTNRPLTPIEIKKTINELSLKECTLTKGMVGSSIGVLNNLIGDVGRHLLYWWLFRDGEYKEVSSKELTPGQLYSIYSWIDSQPVEENIWVPSGLFLREIQDVMNVVRHDMLTAPHLTQSGNNAIIESAQKIGGKVTEIKPKEPVETFIF